MWAMVIVVVAPGRDKLPGVAQVGEQVLVEALVAQAAVEALDEAIRHGLSWRDVMPLDLSVLLPFQNGIRGQLRPIIADEHAGIAARSGDTVELTGNALARQRGVHDRSKAFPLHDAKPRTDCRRAQDGPTITG